jgi:hypothetical protein
MTPGFRQIPLVIVLAAYLAVTRVALLVLPFQSVHGWLRSWSGILAALGRDLTVPRLAGCVAWVNRRMFGPDACLTEGLLAESLLRALGKDATLRIGVAREPGGGIDAHAWVECERQVVTGQIDDLARYVPLENGALQRGLATWLARPGRPFHVRKAT